MSKGALGLLSAYWPRGPARYPHVPFERVTKGCVHDPAERDGERIALVAGAQRLTFRELSARTRAIASALRGRAEPGSRVAILVEDPAELLPCAMGALEADLLIWLSPASPETATLAAFQPDVIVTSGPMEVAGEEPRPFVVTPADLLEGGGPEIIATANIGCLAHLETGTAHRVVHWIELLDT